MTELSFNNVTMEDQTFFQQHKKLEQEKTKNLQSLLKQEIKFQDKAALCSKCGQYSLRYQTRQLRKRDEAETAIYKCTNEECK